jgi:hypothetical protein
MLYRIRLHLARSREFPNGSTRHGYEIVAPLDVEGILDAEAWHEQRERCAVRRFWAGEPDQHGRLLHSAGGAGGATWVIDYDEDRSDDDEKGYRFDRHSFVAGQYVTVNDQHGEHTFRVADVEEAADQ